jgi:SnoaL-like domain
MTSQRWISQVLPFSVLVLCALTTSSGTPSGGHADDQQTIRQLNEQCLHANDIADAATLDRIEGADFTISGDFGVVRKQQQLDAVRQRTRKPEVIKRKIEPQQFRFYNGVALVTETDRPITKDGMFAFQSTEVWVRRDDSWKLVHLHYSRVEEKP